MKQNEEIWDNSSRYEFQQGSEYESQQGSEDAPQQVSEYESLHQTVIVNDRLKPMRIIPPVIVILLIIGVMCVYTYHQEKNIIWNVEQVTNQMAESIAGNIANEMDYARSSIKFASSSISQSMTSNILVNPSLLIGPMVANSPFDDIEYIRGDGMNVMNIGEPFDASDRVYYIEGMKGNTGVWNNYHPKTSRETLMNFYTPIYYRGDISGVLTGYIAATTQISPLFERELYGEDIYGLLLDENEMVICSTLDTGYIADLGLEQLIEKYGASLENVEKIREAVQGAGEKAVSHKGPGGEGRICVSTIPGTKWTVVILVPKASFNAVVLGNIRDSLVTVLIISLILITYATSVLLRNIKRRKWIARENAKLEEENRIFNEENKRVFRELSAIRDINASANMGTWRIEWFDEKEPRMYVDDTMKRLLGVWGKERTPEETYQEWFSHIAPTALSSVFESLEKMKQGKFDENTYLWSHPGKGERYVRCGGTAQKMQNGYLFRGYHYDVDEVVRDDLARVAMLRDALNEKNDYYNTLGTLAGIYNSMHVINLVEDTAVEYCAKDSVRRIVNPQLGAAENVSRIISAYASEECRERALEYTDLGTLAQRMKNKKYIATQLISKRIGWFLASFITVEADEEGVPTRVIFTTQSIDEEKRQEERLIRQSRTDELTGLFNRRAYEEDIYEHDDIPDKDEFVCMSLDVNGLKVVNDTLGHGAGDELLMGASQCMKQSLGSYGRIYRTGGDEFMAILFCDRESLKKALEDFEKRMKSWRGRLVEHLAISYGYISKEEAPDLSVRELGTIADKRMYEAKASYYRDTGVDRGGYQDANRALSELYTKILKVNLTRDTYQIVSMNLTEQAAEMGFTNRISTWLSSFGSSGQVHPMDLQEYLQKTEMGFLKGYFAENKAPLSLFYRRKFGEEFKLAMMEMIRASDYSDANQSLYLYVKRIEAPWKNDSTSL